MTHNKKIEKPKLIIGEGKEDFLFFYSLIKHLEINDIQVDFYNGKNNLNNYFKTLHLKPGFSNLYSLGITRDADQSFDTASQSIDNSIIQNQLNEKKNLTIKKFIFPDNSSSGMLEDLCLRAIDDSDIGCITDFFQCINKNKNIKPTEFSKAKIHAWLSSQVKPDKRLGEAAQAGYIDWNHPNFNPLINFIKSL